MKKIVLFILCLCLSVSIFGKHSVGEYYQGGKIFYVDKSGEHGLIAALFDSTTAPVKWTSWPFPVSGNSDGFGTTINNGQLTMLGKGKKFTEFMLDTFKGKPSIADYATNCADGGYTDWYIPSIDELYFLLYRWDVVGNLTFDSYYQSSKNQNDYGGVFYYWTSSNSFGYGVQHLVAKQKCQGTYCPKGIKPEVARVRLIRQF